MKANIMKRRNETRHLPATESRSGELMTLKNSLGSTVL